jgi:hypothetical protein
VESGLATIESKTATEITFKLSRPHDLTKQTHLAEFLCGKVPLELATNGTLKWEKILEAMDPVQGNNLLIARVVVPGLRGGYKVDHESPGALAQFTKLEGQKLTSSRNPQNYWKNRVQQLQQIALDEHVTKLQQCHRELKKTLPNNSLTLLKTTAGELRKDREGAIAEELEMAYKTLVSGVGPLNEESAPDLNSWDGVLPVLREAGLIKSRVNAGGLQEITRTYDQVLPFKLEDLAGKAMLWEKERELRGFYKTLDLSFGSELTAEKLQKREARLDDVDSDNWEDIFDDDLERDILLTQADEEVVGKRKEYRQAYNAIKTVYEQLKDETPRPSIEQMAGQLLKDKPIQTLNYGSEDWQRAHRMLTEGY